MSGTSTSGQNATPSDPECVTGASGVESAADRVAGYLRAQRDAIRATAALVPVDVPDSVHRLRVATRRLRSSLRTFRPLLGSGAEGLGDELRWFAGELADLRDHEVLREVLSAALAAEPPDLVPAEARARIDAVLAGGTSRGRDRARASLSTARYATLLGAVDAFVAVPWRAEPPADAVRGRTRAALRRLLRDLAAADDDETLHRARKSAKRARYAVEAVGAAGGELRRRLVDAQDVLGAQHDTVVVRELLVELAVAARQAGESTFGYGVLYAAQRATARELVGDLPALARRVRAAC